jgi:glutamate/tyrosine decarboxylase-like PLP-dependent enzyme
MSNDHYGAPLDTAHRLALEFLSTLRDRPVHARETDPAPPFTGLPRDGMAADAILRGLAALIERGGLATPGPRYFGFVTGGTLPAAMAADWLVSAWDQNAALHVMSPAIAALEDQAAAWLLDLFRLPATASVGFVTGATMANATCLAAARDAVLRRAGWDVERGGLQRAPRLTIVAGRQAHASIDSACRLLGFGTDPIVRIEGDGQGRMVAADLARVLADVDGPLIVCLQAGHVNTGAFDRVRELIPLARERQAWVHVDGAFGLWARVAPELAELSDGLELADSWAVDAHKWLNVPYDGGIAIVTDQAAHRAAMAQRASYLVRAEGERRDGMDWTPEASRRARAVPIYAALLSLGRAGVTALLSRCCVLAARMAAHLQDQRGVHLLNDVVLNQVLVRFTAEDGSNITPEVIARVQQDGVCWAGGTEWLGEPAMRISVSNWSTTPEDIDTSARAILAAAQAASAIRREA